MGQIKKYSELIKLKTFKERFEYLKLDSNIGDETFGFNRYLNQNFYKSKEWLNIRNKIIIRDRGCDLGLSDREIIDGKILVHHINPITKEDLNNNTNILLDPENLITVTKNTHDAIHYGSEESLINIEVQERQKNDTCPWRH